jgi:NTP pyrophosphatase (non-canonical NTP hydrolase)
MNYIKEALRTEAADHDAQMKRLSTPEMTRLLHAAIGMQTESAELSDALKKHIYYGKPLDKVNLIEELGDQFWYLAIMCDALGTTFEEVQQININKLKARYPDKFTQEKAEVRDLEKERAVLEAKEPAVYKKKVKINDTDLIATNTHNFQEFIEKYGVGADEEYLTIQNKVKLADNSGTVVEYYVRKKL